MITLSSYIKKQKLFIDIYVYRRLLQKSDADFLCIDSSILGEQIPYIYTRAGGVNLARSVIATVNIAR